MSDYFEMREGLFKQYMKKAHWQCYPRGFSPFTREIPSYHIIVSMDTPEGIYVESYVIPATTWATLVSKSAYLGHILKVITYRLKMGWHAS